MARRPDELEQFKTQINLTEYAAAQGYALDRRATSRNSAVMKTDDGDKVIIAQGRDRHWIYFSVRDLRDSGSIIDFVQNRRGGNLGDVRKELRPWLRSGAVSRPPASAYVPSLKPVAKDLVAVRARYEGMTPLDGHSAYLEEQRGIPAHILTDPGFAERIRTDDHGNTVFPHYNRDGLCGYEIKNEGFTGFAKGGKKGLWASRIDPADRRLVVTETAIDALSYAAIRGVAGSRFVSIGGQMNPEQPVLLRLAIDKMPEGSQIVIAVDNDDGGDDFTRRMEAVFAEISRADLTLVHDRPPTTAKDWNDALRASMAKVTPGVSPTTGHDG